MDEAPFASDSFGKLAENSSIMIEVATSNRKDINPQSSKVPELRPERAEVEPVIAGGIREHCQQIPVTVRTVRLSRTAAEQPDFLRLQHFEYALHNAIGEAGCRHGFNDNGNS